MGFLKKLKIYDSEREPKEAGSAAKVSRDEFTAAAIRNLAEASKTASSNVDLTEEEDDFIPDPALNTDSAENTVSEPPQADAGTDISIGNPAPDKKAVSSDNIDAEKPVKPEKIKASANIKEEEEKTSKKKSRRKHNSFSKNHPKVIKRTCIALSSVAAVCLAIFVYGCATAPKDRMGRNIYIENINVSNMTFDEALAAVSREQLLSSQNITITCSGQDYEINGIELGLSPRLEDTVDKAMRYGKTTNIFINGLANSLQLFSRHTVIPSANVNEAVLREKLSDFGKQIYGELIEHRLEIGDGVVICTPGCSGFDNNTDTACDEVLQAINGNEKFSNISVTLNKGAPRTLTGKDIDNFTYKDPENAYYSLDGGSVTVMPEQPGRIIDVAQADELAAQITEGGEVIMIPFTYAPAEITADILQAKLFNATIGSYSTSYGTSNANRCANIANAARRINGRILMPGDVFSFNDAVGPRSAANGFHTAKEYVNGETVDGIGGGTCQVSSTLYNACIYSDLSIISRTSHMFPVGYCPLGQDATVAYGSVDYKFVNSMNYPIKISAVTSGYTITVSIIGTQRDDPRTVKIVNTTTRVGEDTRVTTVRQVYNSAGELISTDNLPGSYYKPHD